MPGLRGLVVGPGMFLICAGQVYRQQTYPSWQYMEIVYYRVGPRMLGTVHNKSVTVIRSWFIVLL